MGASFNQADGSGSRRRGRRGRKPPMSDINVTPMVDVMLVLLIIFMVTAPLLTAGVPIELPQSKGKQLASPKETPVTISVQADGKVFIQEAQVPLNEIVTKLLAIAKAGYNQQIYVRGDKAISYGEVMKVMGRISAAGFKKVSLVTDLQGQG